MRPGRARLASLASLALLATSAAPCLLAALGLALVSAAAHGQSTLLVPGEQVEFFATDAVLDSPRDVWVVPIHALIFQPSNDAAERLALQCSFSGALRLPADSPKSEIYAKRSAAFVVSAEQDEHLVVTLAGQTFRLAASEPDGHVHDTLELPGAAVRALGEPPPGELELALVLPAADRRRFEGRIRLLPPTGLSVIADLDDTLVVAEAGDQGRMLARSFLKPFEALPGMAALCASAAAEGATFHYLSASPWQLHAPLAEFLESAGFPLGSLTLSDVRWPDHDGKILEAFARASDHKVVTAATIATRLPGHQLILLGDSAGHDPEYFGEIARRIPARIEFILIHDTAGGKRDDPRYAAAFRAVPPERWTLFASADELTTLRAPPPPPPPKPDPRGEMPKGPLLH